MRTAISASIERRIRRETRSAILRERALALHQAGWTYAAIGVALGLSLTRAFQLVRKAKRLMNEGALSQGRPLDSTGPLQVGRRNTEQLGWYDRPPT